MEAIFVVPTMVSDQVEPRLVPAIAKLVERNILINNASNFRIAAYSKYLGYLKTMYKENYVIEADPYHMGWGKEKEPEKLNKIMSSVKDKATKIGGDVSIKAGENLATAGHAGSAEKDEGPRTADAEALESPSGITFFNSITLEPTFLQIKVITKASKAGELTSPRLIRIGIKCVPYTIDGVSDLLSLMNNLRSVKKVEGYWKSEWNHIKRQVFKSAARSYDPSEGGEDSVRDIISAPKLSYLTDPRILSKMMDSRGPAYWAPLTIFSSSDFEGDDMVTNLKKYKTLVRNGWGDMVILNEPKESIHFCMQRLMACYEMPVAYLKLAMRLDPILDYSELVRGGGSAKPWRVSPVRKAFAESGDIVPKEAIKMEVVDQLNSVFGLKEEVEEYEPEDSEIEAAFESCRELPIEMRLEKVEEIKRSFLDENQKDNPHKSGNIGAALGATYGAKKALENIPHIKRVLKKYPTAPKVVKGTAASASVIRTVAIPTLIGLGLGTLVDRWKAAKKERNEEKAKKTEDIIKKEYEKRKKKGK
jgi:hypothetical protein